MDCLGTSLWNWYAFEKGGWKLISKVLRGFSNFYFFREDVALDVDIYRWLGVIIVAIEVRKIQDQESERGW
jgi:hypothetical protein